MKNLKKIATTVGAVIFIGSSISPLGSQATNWFGSGVGCPGGGLERPAHYSVVNGVRYSVCPVVPPYATNSVCCTPR